MVRQPVDQLTKIRLAQSAAGKLAGDGLAIRLERFRHDEAVAGNVVEGRQEAPAEKVPFEQRMEPRSNQGSLASTCPKRSWRERDSRWRERQGGINQRDVLAE